MALTGGDHTQPQSPSNHPIKTLSLADDDGTTGVRRIQNTASADEVSVLCLACRAICLFPLSFSYLDLPF